MRNEKKENIYLAKNIKMKQIILGFIFFVDAWVFISSILIGLIAVMDFSAAPFGLFLFLSISSGILVYLIGRKLVCITIAKYYSKEFMKLDKPFFNVFGNKYSYIDKDSVRLFVRDKLNNNLLKMIERTIKQGYLKNCTIEVHNGVPKIALSKKIVKDTCPNCGAPIVGVVSDVYVCRYCGKKIYNVVEKK